MWRLAGAIGYERITGYFTSSLFEVEGEVLAHISKVKIVCNVSVRERLDKYIYALRIATGFNLRYIGTMMPLDKYW